MFAASLAMSALGAGASYMDAQGQVKSQAAYQEAQMKAHNDAMMQNAKNAIDEQVEQTAAERMQQMQESQSAARQMQVDQKEFLEKRGTAMASNPYAAGASFDALMADYERSRAFNRDVTKEQLDMQGVAHDVAARSYRDRAQTRIDSQQGFIPAPINSGASIWTSALGLGSSALKSYNKATNYGKTPLWSKDATKV
jgi:hypothetical protein